MGISIGSCHQILTEKLQRHRVSAKFVPRLLTDDQKENRVEISQELLANANGNENFLKKIITGWDMGLWVWWWNKDAIVAVEGERVSSTNKKKARMSRSKFKVMLVVFFDWKSIVHHELVSRGQMVTVLPGSFSAFEGCCAQEVAWIVGKPDLDLKLWHLRCVRYNKMVQEVQSKRN